jgi:lipoyl(octanoyl) transferase
MNTAYGEDSRDELWICRLGTIPYLEAVAIQQRVQEQRQRDEIPDVLLLLEHPPVFTRGRRSRDDELPLGEDVYRARGVEVIGTNRGGRITYHGPGQLVGYPIMRIDSTHVHLRRMEDAIINALAGEGIHARTRCAEGPDYTGVWVGDRKIASIGVHVARGVTTHGFAVNVDNDLAPFSWVIACGLPGTQMTSVAEELAAGDPGSAESFRLNIAGHFSDAHSRRANVVSPEALGLPATDGAQGPSEHRERVTMEALTG